MGKKKKNKQIKNSFKGWDEVTPEDQMRIADEFANINKDTADNILGLGTSKNILVDKETGLESEIVNDIVKTFGVTEKEPIKENINTDEISDSSDNESDTVDQEIIYDDTDTIDDTPKDIPETEEEDMETPFVVDEDDDDDEGYTYPAGNFDTETTNKEAISDVKDNATSEDNIIKDDDYYIDVRKFGCIIKQTIGVAVFNDGTAPFTINEHTAMLEGLAKDIDTSSIDDAIIELFKKALIVNRYPAALYTKDEFINLLGKGKFVQRESEHAIFVDVLNEYIAVYFVYNDSIDRFSETITNIIKINDEDEYGSPFYNVWTYLATILDNDNHSFIGDEDIVEMFYKSSHNDKEIVEEYLKDKYIVPSEDEDVVVSIIGRSNVEEKFTYVMDEILDILDDEDEDDDVEEEVSEEVTPITNQNEAQAAIAKALAENANKKSDNDSMVIPVFHKEGKK